MIKTLIPMVDFVQLDEVQQSNFYYPLTQNYAKFLKQPLELWMFIPCDEEGNVLEKPNPLVDVNNRLKKQYQQAKDRVLFEGFTMFGKDCIELKESNGKSKVDIFIYQLKEMTAKELISYDITLTPTAINQLGL